MKSFLHLLKTIFIITGMMILVASCKFSQPLLRVRINKSDYIDSTSHKRIVRKEYVYPSIRNLWVFGLGSSISFYSDKGYLVRKHIMKQSYAVVVDKRMKFYIKETENDSIGEFSSARYRITQLKKEGSQIIYDKTVYKDGHIE